MVAEDNHSCHHHAGVREWWWPLLSPLNALGLRMQVSVVTVINAAIIGAGRDTVVASGGHCCHGHSTGGDDVSSDGH